MNKEFKTEKRIKSFWNRVEKKEYCWEWTGYVNQNGYGKTSFYLRGKSIPVFVHRYSYYISFGEIADGLLVCHHCDNPKCVRPSHLFLGSHRDNKFDCVRKKRDINSRKKECKYGHLFDFENTGIDKRGNRFCIKCRKEDHYKRMDFYSKNPEEREKFLINRRARRKRNKTK